MCDLLADYHEKKKMFITGKILILYTPNDKYLWKTRYEFKMIVC